jgi:hypothetical protein
MQAQSEVTLDILKSGLKIVASDPFDQADEGGAQKS